jgi:hypothetical protein
MTIGWFSVAMLRLAAIVLPAWVIAHVLRLRFLRASGAVAALAEAVLALGVVLVGAELLGLVSLMRFAPLLVLLWVAALVSLRWSKSNSGKSAHDRVPGVGEQRKVGGLSAAIAVVVVVAQWLVQTANALGGGMFNFDTLWYHMPFAARFAETGSVTAIQFTQADPFVAYYPANSELFHALGIVALHNDFLSPVINLMWLAIALLAAWCIGARWGIQRLTLTAGALVMSLPVLSTTQPGEAFNDIVGLATLLAAVALVSGGGDDMFQLVVAGLALGIAVGTKYTFIIPAAAMIAGIAWRAPRAQRTRTFGALTAPLAVTGGWWYLRDLIAVGNPLGLRIRLGPLQLPGPVSALANALQQTVISEIRHLSLWGSRFAPGLDHALGPLWPLLLIAYLGAVIAGVALTADTTVRVLAVTAALAGVSYMFFPTGASALQQGTTLFEVNLRYAMPALALAIVLIPILASLRAPSLLPILGPAFLLVLVASQLEHALWPTQTARHLVFLLGTTTAATVAWNVRRMRPTRLAIAVPVAASILLVGAGATFAVQRHYFARRYLLNEPNAAGLGAIYRWAQTVSHARIALYGTLEQYPLYGARDTNQVDYLGVRTPAGGFRPIANCRSWRTTISTGRYQYLVLTPGPTTAIPIDWTQPDPALAMVLHPTADDYVFRITGPLHPQLCAR